MVLLNRERKTLVLKKQKIVCFYNFFVETEKKNYKIIYNIFQLNIRSMKPYEFYLFAYNALQVLG